MCYMYIHKCTSVLVLNYSCLFLFVMFLSHFSTIDYVAIRPRFFNLVLQSPLVLLRKLPPLQVSYVHFASLIE